MIMLSGLPDFDRRAPLYESHAGLQRDAAAWLAEWLPAEIDGPALELGAGTGLFTQHLAARTRQLKACDVAPRMVEIGRATLPDLQWSVAEADNPPGPSGYRSFFSSSLLQWVPDPLATFQAWHRLAAPGARLLSGWFVRGTLDDFYALCPDAIPFRWRSTAEWLSLLREAGWEVSRSETRTFTREHPNAVAMLREMHNAGTTVPRRLGVSRLRHALRQYAQTGNRNAAVQTNFVFLRVEAVRT